MSFFEIYPLSRFQNTADDSTRLGFAIDDFDKRMSEINDSIILSNPKETEWGRMAVVKDPDGRRVELYQEQLSV